MKELIKTRFTKPKSTFLKTLWRKRIIALFAAFLLTGIGQVVHGQEIMHVEEAISEMLASDDPDIFAEGMHLQSLLVDIHPSLYINNGELSPHGSGSPIVLYPDAYSIQELYNTHPLFTQVELITITIHDDQEIPDAVMLDQMTGFPNLQYVYVKFGYDPCQPGSSPCIADMLSQVFTGTESPALLLYSKSVLH